MLIAHYLSTTMRVMTARIKFTVLNICGLALGLCGCLLMLLYVLDALGYDHHWPNAERIYRVEAVYDSVSTDRVIPLAGNMATELLQHHTVEQAGRMSRFTLTVLQQQQSFRFDRAFYVEPALFDILTPQALFGDVKSALQADGTAVVSATVAKQLFGRVNVVGEMLQLPEGKAVQIAAVINDADKASHWQYDVWLPMATLRVQEGDKRIDNWLRNDFYTYVRLPASSDLRSTEAQISTLLAAPLQSMIPDLQVHFYLRAVTDIYLDSHGVNELGVNGNRQLVWLFSIVALTVLAIAIFNYVNFAIVLGARRAREIGLRKLAGANTAQLFSQFMVESVVTVLLAIALSIVLVLQLLPWFNQLLDLSLQLSTLWQAQYWAFMLALTVATAFIAGGYPAFVISRFDLLSSLHGMGFKGVSGQRFRKVVLCIQFVVALSLLICGGHLYQQMRHIEAMDVGFERSDRILLADLPSDWLHSIMPLLTQQLTNVEGVYGITAAEQVPTFASTNFVQLRQADKADRKIDNVAMIAIQPHYLTTLGVSMLAGSEFNAPRQSDQTNAVLINELAAKALGFSDAQQAIGRYIDVGFDPYFNQKQTAVVQGVFANYYTFDVQQPMQPLVLTLNKPTQNDSVLLLHADNQRWATIEPVLTQLLLSQGASSLAPYQFLDERFQRLHQVQQRQSHLIKLFTLFSLIIVSFGLMGLTHYNLERQTKSLSLRLLMGASKLNLYWLCGREYLHVLLVAIFPATGLAAWLNEQWLHQFATNIGQQWGWYVFSIVFTAILTFVLVVVVMLQIQRWSLSTILKAE